MTNEVQTFSDVACTVCGCVCDDLELDIKGERILQARGACKLAEPWFFALNHCQPAAAAIEGQAAPFEEAIARAAHILRGSTNPLIFGLSRSSTRGQRAAVRLAEQLRGNIDTTASVCHGPSIMAMQQVGESTCSLGEVRNRADLVIFWGANPVESHPRHFERYSVEPIGEFIPRGRQDRTVLVIDTKPTATSECADAFFQVKRDGDFELIWMLRQIIGWPGHSEAVPRSQRRHAIRVDDARKANETGIPLEAIHDLARRIMSCRYGIVFFGLGLAQRGLGHLTVEALLRLVEDLNAHTRFCARRLRVPGDVAGADGVLCWQTGFPFAVNFSRGYPRYNPGEFTANELLSRNESDACLLVGSESVAMLSAPAQAALRRIPTIVLDYPHVDAPWQPTVQFKTAVYGIHAPGTAYRMDEIPIPLRSVMTSPYNTDDEILTALVQLMPA
jgi:formylmethanofuran dehydrogenase subunit B